MDKRAHKRTLGAPAGMESLVDLHRVTPRTDGGIYTDGNVQLVTPTEHAKEHGVFRSRDETLEELKSVFDDRAQTMKLLMKVNNQLLAYERRADHRHPDTERWLKAQLVPFQDRLTVIDRDIKGILKDLREQDPLTDTALNVPSLGPVTAAALAVYVDLSKADSASALWKYVGLHAPSHERYQKGQASGGNKTLRTILYNAATAMMKNRNCPYRTVYDRTKARLEVSEKITLSRNTQGKLVETPWSRTKPSHRHGAALRAIMKHLLADYWFVGRELAGLPTRSLYAEGRLGHTGIVSPRERGWNW